MGTHRALVCIDNIPALGQNIYMGCLYDIRANNVIKDDLSKENLRIGQITDSMKSTHFRVSASDTFKQRSSLMDISTDILLSLLSPPISLTGSAKYLESRNSNTKSISVTLRLTKLDLLKRLNKERTTEHFFKMKEKSEATHIISEITYGSDCYFIFEQKVEDGQFKEDVRDSLSVIIECAIERVSGKYSTSADFMRASEKDKLKCRFYGDFQIPSSPTTFDEAMVLLQKIVKGTVKRTSKPISFSIEPLEKIMNVPNSPVVFSISETIILRVCRLRNYQERCLQEFDDLIGSNIFSNNSFEKVRKFIEEVKRMFSDNNLKFNERICHLLKQIKSGKADEAEMLYLINMFEQSRFGKDKYALWYDDMKLEIQFVEQILMKIGTCEEISEVNNILLSKGKNRMEYFKHRDQNNNGGIYELSISLQSLMDIKLLDHLEAEFMVSREGRNFDEYPMSPSFLNDNNSKDTNTKFITHLSQKIDAFKRLSQFKTNEMNSNLLFVAVINYPSESENNASINFGGNGVVNNDVDLDFELKIQQLCSREEGLSEFCCQICPSSVPYSSDGPYQNDIQNYPDIELELLCQRFDKTSKIYSKEIGLNAQENGKQIISLPIPSSTFPYIVRGIVKFIGGARHPQVLQNFVYSILFCNLRYDSYKHQLIVDIGSDDTSDKDVKGVEHRNDVLFDVEFRYRNVEGEGKECTKIVKGKPTSKNCFSGQLEDVDKGYYECQCRYVVKKEHNYLLGADSKYYALMEGGKEGSWSLVQYLVLEK